MQIERVVVNSSPLIILFRGQLESLLPKLFVEICITPAVWSEVTGSGYSDEPSFGLVKAKWAKRGAVKGISASVAAWDLGIGESEVLSFALEHPGFRAVLDDKAARRCAKTLGIQILGTGGILVLAKRRGLLESVTDSINHLREEGLWMSDELVDLILKEAGEK